MYHKAKEMLQKARQEKHGGYSSILERWNNDYHYRKSLSDMGWTKEHIMLHDRIALENRSCVATEAERIVNSVHWILTLNQDGAQQPFFNDLTLLKRKENARDCTTNKWQRLNNTIEPFLAISK